MVKRFKLESGLSFVALMLGLSGWANSACHIGADVNALGVQEDSGQGNYNCSVLTTPDGEVMQNLVGDDFTQVTWNSDGTIDWFVDAVDTDGDTLPDSRNNVYLVSTFNKGQGKRCNYLYEDGVAGGDGLGAVDSGAVQTVTICGEPDATPLPAPETDIVTTVGDDCLASFSYEGVTDDRPAVSFGFTAGSTELVAACAGYSPDGPAPGLSQVQCAPPPNQIRTPVGDCDTPNLDGSYPLSCAPVEWNAGDLKYCWYYENRVCELTSPAPYCEGRILGTFIPKTKKSSLNVSIDVMDGSTCYTYYLRGRAYYHCY